MTIQICNNNISLDNQRIELVDAEGRKHGLYVTQRNGGTVVYSGLFTGSLGYRDYKMPHDRYSLTHDVPRSGSAGLSQFEADIRAFIQINVGNFDKPFIYTGHNNNVCYLFR